MCVCVCVLIINIYCVHPHHYRRDYVYAHYENFHYALLRHCTHFAAPRLIYTGYAITTDTCTAPHVLTVTLLFNCCVYVVAALPFYYRYRFIHGVNYRFTHSLILLLVRGRCHGVLLLVGLRLHTILRTVVVYPCPHVRCCALWLDTVAAPFVLLLFVCCVALRSLLYSPPAFSLRAHAAVNIPILFYARFVREGRKALRSRFPILGSPEPLLFYRGYSPRCHSPGWDAFVDCAHPSDSFTFTLPALLTPLREGALLLLLIAV